MKIVLKNISTFFKKKETASEQKSSRNPYRDWLIIFIFSIVIFIIMVGVNAYIFFGIQSETLFSTAAEIKTPAKKISPQKLDEALQLMTAREISFAELKIKKPVITDPSI